VSQAFRILVLFGNVPLLGQELSNIRVLEALRAAGSDVLFLIRGEWTRDTIQPELNRCGLPWVAVPYFDTVRRGQSLRVWVRNLAGILGGSWHLLRWHRRFRPTHIHAASPEHIVNFLPALALLRTPLVYRAGDAPVLHHWLWRAVWSFAIWRVNCFVPNSRYVQGTLLASGIPPAKIVRAGGIAPLLPGRVSSGHAALPPPRPDLCTFVYLGQLAAHKGVDLLIEAAIARCSTSRGCRFLLAGNYSWNNPFADALRARVQRLGLADRIVFLGYVTDVPGLLGLADVHVCPSVAEEPFGNVVIEAKQMRKPSIIFPSGGLPELVEHGIDGYVCQEKSASALEAAFACYEGARDTAREQGNAATRSLDRLAGAGTFAEQWARVYEAAATRSRKRRRPLPAGFAGHPRRILALLGSVPLWGLELGNMDVLEAMRAAGSDVLFLIRGEWTRDTIQPELNRRGLPWAAVPCFDAIRRGHGLRVWLRNLGGILGGSWHLLRWHRRFHPTHIHAASSEHILNFLPALALLRTPLVYRAGDVPVLHHWLWRAVWRFTIRRASRVVAISGYMEDTLLASGVPAEKIVRVTNVAPLHPVRATSDRASLPPRRHDRCTFVYLGQLTAQKGVDLFVDAAISRCRASSGCRFLLAGDYARNNPFADALRARVQQLGLADRIIFLGYVSEVPRLLDLGDVHVCPSIIGEGFGNVVIEAKQRGKPSIIFPSGALAELVEHSVDGYVCHDKSASALERAFAFYEDHPGKRHEHGRMASRSLARLSGTATFTEQWLRVYDSALTPGGTFSERTPGPRHWRSRLRGGTSTG
jgi:glycosyltransferase involved in cell wall biosynthesis